MTPDLKLIERLEPCPFCGGKAKLQQIDYDPDDISSGGYYIECQNALCQTSSALIVACGDDPIPQLVERWNKRPAISRDYRARLDGVKDEDVRKAIKCLENEAKHFLVENEFSDIERVEDVYFWRVARMVESQAHTIEELRKQLETALADAARFRLEVNAIANARRFDKEYFDDDQSFVDWARSRCRGGLAQSPGASESGMTKEWCERMARLENGAEVGAGPVAADPSFDEQPPQSPGASE